MKKITIIMLLMLGICISEGYAQEIEQTPPSDFSEQEAVPQEHYIFPDIKPEISLSGGYRYVHTNGSNRAEEFEYLHNSLVLGGELRSISVNNRLHLDLDIKNEKDYYGDISYAYKDLILLRGVNSTLFHNLDNIRLFSFAGDGLPAESRDPADEKYGLKVGISNFILRFKAPDYPAHLYFEGNFVEKDGTEQQRFYNYLTGNRISEKRDIDLRTSIYTIGANSHLGPVEVDFSHGEKRLDVGGDKALIDKDAIGFDVPGIVGNYFHNQISELESSNNTLKLHTSYTGRLVASATFSKTDKENRDSHATADYLFAAGEVTWMPMPKLTFFAKYRHQERDVDNPETVTVQNLSTGAVFPFPVINPISSISDSVTGTIRYRPFKGVVLRAEYTYEDIRRDNVEEWPGIPPSTQRQKLSFSGDVKILSNLKFKAKYAHRDINNPSTNIEPDHSDEGIMTLSWTPLSGLNAYLNYSIKKEKRDSLRFISDTIFGQEVVNVDGRKVKNDGLIGTVSYALLKNLSIAASYAYMHNNIRQDIMYNTSPDHPPTTPPATDLFVPYKTTSRNYVFGVNYSPKSFVILNGGISRTVSDGTFYTSAPALDSIASFSALKIREMTYSVSGEYQFKGGVSAGIRYRYSTFKDLLDNIYDDVNDGRVSIVLLTISKKW